MRKVNGKREEMEEKQNENGIDRKRSGNKDLKKAILTNTGSYMKGQNYRVLKNLPNCKFLIRVKQTIY